MRKIIVVGGGMVGTRFAGEVAAELARAGQQAQITMLGEEPHAPYNRVLLSEVVAGRMTLAGITMPELPDSVTQLRGVRVRAVDRAHRRIRTDEGLELGYDDLVLATGAHARIPDIEGMEDGHGVRVLRTLDDARGIIAVAAVGTPIGVLGGGVLGVEVAAGLAGRGAQVSLLHTGDAPMQRQLDADSAAVVAQALRESGIDVLGDADACAIERTDGRMRGVRLGDGRFVPAETLIITAGIEPATELARAAGLSIDEGILVGNDLRSIDDPNIAAIGDCAQPPEGIRGLIGPGWEQARRLSRAMAGIAVAPAPLERDVVRLKAGSISAVTLGDATLLREPSDVRLVSLYDPRGGRSIKVATDGDQLRAAVCVGAPEIAAELQALFERHLSVPADPAHLLLDRSLLAAPSGEASITKIPDSATLCRCNGVTKGHIIAAYRAGDRSVAEVAARTRATTGCGGCAAAVGDALVWLKSADPDAESSSPAASHTEAAVR
ncbi:FAD-dependent oxidoreductase [Cumulibacter soli]|uniref:FAD-dependent oxidoreductase n=1 Tax=Cumulibacter soli TaxID=2546344 RepID=UPI0010672735|nr:FAD-dependent oxidoreductase [Cumulibacter soli]